MRTFYHFVVALGIGGLAVVILLTAENACGQNFAGTAGAGQNLSGSEADEPEGAVGSTKGQDLPQDDGAVTGGTGEFVEPLIRSADQPAEPFVTGGEAAEAGGEAAAENAGIPDFVRFMSHYTLGVDDVIEIVVLRHPEVSGQFAVNSEGNIQYEFVGDIPVEGKTKDEVRETLAGHLSSYILSPEVTVKIIGYNSKIVYVIGEVANPGKIFMRGDTITVREALVQAGLPLLSAKTGDGRVITPSADGNPKVRKVNVSKLLYNGDLREDLIMQPGDTLYVPPTFLAKTMRVLQPVAAPIGTAAGTGRTVTTGF